MNSLALNAARPVFSRNSRMRVIMVRAFCDRMHERIIKMPSVMTAKVCNLVERPYCTIKGKASNLP